MMTADSVYGKPHFTLPQQVSQLVERGMDCGNASVAYRELERYGYYRLSGYWYPFREVPRPPAPSEDDLGREIRLETFVEGTSLSKIVEIYKFDDELRTRLGSVLSAVEVAFRFFVSHRMGKVDPFIHRKPDLFEMVTQDENGEPRILPTYEEWIEEYDRLEKRAKSSFVQHFREKYGPHLPLWVATEVMSFGALSRFFDLMPQEDKRVIADRLQVSRQNKEGRLVGETEVLSNWLNSFRHARNLCRHYSRIWNRVFDL
ncbi:Abi family protein [Corynebacterium lubricantis]|uniref:Abi family protein n=1 Tax=Corynebacterium lubricantis TaxID=541095 RepID=UPI000A0038E7|nr:Abi family protein [Corynebacterium lubricantis]